MRLPQALAEFSNVANFSYTSLFVQLVPPRQRPNPTAPAHADISVPHFPGATNSKSMCFLHVGKSGGNSISSALSKQLAQNGTLDLVVVVHASAFASRLRQLVMLNGNRSTIMRFTGPFAEGTLAGHLAKDSNPLAPCSGSRLPRPANAHMDGHVTFSLACVPQLLRASPPAASFFGCATRSLASYLRGMRPYVVRQHALLAARRCGSRLR